MICKTVEIRDRGTFIPALAIRLEPTCEADRYLLARAGFGLLRDTQREYVLLIENNGGEGQAHCDPHEWHNKGPRTWPFAHQWLIEHFDEIESGAVVDVEFILGETTAPKVSESMEAYI